MYFDVRCVPVTCSVRDMHVDGMLLHRVIGVVVKLQTLQVLVTMVLVRIVCVIAFSRYHVDAFQVLDGRVVFSPRHPRHGTVGMQARSAPKKFLDVACTCDGPAPPA